MQIIIKEFSPRERENINICLNRLCRFDQRVMANGNHEIYDISEINVYGGRGKIFCCGREKKERAYIELIDTTKRLISTISVGLDEYVIFEINNYEISIFVEHASIDSRCTRRIRSKGVMGRQPQRRKARQQSGK